VVIASAKGASLYEVDLTTLQAKPLGGEQNLHIYDLASKYFANDKAVSIMLMPIWIFIRQEWMKSILTLM
jgi:hypothetical protein